MGRHFHNKEAPLLNWKTVTRPKSKGGLGIKRSRCRNLAFLAKRNWELQLGSHGKWAHLLRSKYPLNRALNYRKSVTWKSLCSSTPLCDKEKGWLIRDGQSINFWYDIQMGNKYMRESLIGPLARNEGTTTISDVQDSSGLWNLLNLSFNLTHALWNTIQGVPRPLTPSASYSQFQRFSPNGLFNYNSSYHLALNIETPFTSSFCWKWLWKINTITRVISLLWLACHYRLPTKSFLNQRHITWDDLCPLCKEAPKTIIHILRDCRKVKPIWTRVGNIAPDFYSDISMKPWIKIWSLSSRHTNVLPSVQWRDGFPILSQSIWSTRDKSVMEGAKFNTQAIFHRAKSLAIEFHFSLPSPL